MNLVVIPFHDWKKCEREGFRTRDAHLMQEFERHPAVDKLLVINRPISLTERVVMRRSFRPQAGKLIVENGDAAITQVGDHTYTLDIRIAELLKPLQLKRAWTPYIFGQPAVVGAVEWALSQLDMAADYALFLSAPLFAPLLAQLSPRLVAFDAQDNLLKHSLYRDVPDLERYYAQCLELADTVSANSPQMTQWLQERRPDARYISNAVDKETFDAARVYARPDDLANIPGPIVGYAGKMQEMFDVSLMSAVVEQMPDVHFVFIGQQLDPEWVKPLWRYPNAHYLGDKPYGQLPNYLAAFDVCLIPYDQARQHDVDPIKFYEYLAIGKPIVTSHIGGVGAFAEYPQVRIAEDEAAFAGAVQAFTDSIRAGRPIALQELPERFTWRYKADQIIQALLSTPPQASRYQT
jgi:glycosyltransferase involved in cell wall biosynthesis